MWPVDAVVLVGHGGVPRDFPPADLMRMKRLESERRSSGKTPSDEERALETRIRTWPRTPANDPYQAGLETLATRLRPKLSPARLVLAYNEFCAPSLEDAVADLVAGGARHVAVVPSMLTPGGVHSEVEIPATLASLRQRFAGVELRYAWPFDAGAVAELLALQVRGRGE